MIKELVQQIRREAPIGSIVILKNMKDEDLPEGLKGKVKHIDDIGQIHVEWENGSSLALITDLDDFEIIK